MQGFLWHLGRIFIHYAEEAGILNHMRNIPEVRRIVRLTMALPLLLEQYIRRGLLEIQRKAQDEVRQILALVTPYLQTIYRNWLISEARLRRMCVYGSNQRTNNACESHNRTLRRSLNIHPNIYVFINALVKIERETHDAVIALEEGRRYARARRRTSIMNDARIRNLAEEVLNHPPGARNRSILPFLRAASHVMEGLTVEAMQ